MLVACLALFVALTGTGIAASHYLVTSTKQIKPSVLRALHGKRGPEGPAGPTGFAGAPGARGPAGPEGGTSRLNGLCLGIVLAEIETNAPAENATQEKSRADLRHALETIHAQGC